MNEDPMDEVGSVAEHARQKAFEIAEAAQDGALDALSAAEKYIRNNPWLAVAAAAAAGVALSALVPRHRPQTDRLHAVKEWLEDAYEKIGDQLPDKADIQSMAESCQVSSALSGLGKKLHLW